MIKVYNEVEELLEATADFFVQSARKAIAAHGAFNVALSGGSSPKQLYQKLASPAFRNQVDWNRIYFFFGDERYVPADNPDYNALMAKQTLFDPLHVAEEHIFRVNTALSPEDAAQDYAEAIANHFHEQVARFDLVLLGLGDNSHTASLFPHTPVLEEKEPGVKAVFLEDQQVYRISMTAPLINQAREVAFLVYGAGKSEAVRQVIEGPLDIANHPAQLICPNGGELLWFLDAAAAEKLQKKD